MQLDDYRLTEEGVAAVCETVRDILAPERFAWEAIAAWVCFMGWVVPTISVGASTVPFLVQTPRDQLIVCLILIVLTAGFGWSAARKRGYRGRIIGTIAAASASFALVTWLPILL